MNERADVKRAGPPEELRGIAKWARVYGQNRSLGFVVFVVGQALVALGLLALAHAQTRAYRVGNMPLFWTCLAILVVAIVAIECCTGYCLISQRGRELVKRLIERPYAREGNVTVSGPEIGHSRSLAMLWATCVYAACFMVSVALYLAGVFPSKYMQPVVALCVVPYLVVLWILVRPMIGYLALLFPALYVVHAILVVAGVPILFTGPWEVVLNVAVPAFGYAVLAGLISHAYSRFALYRLKKLTQVGCATGSRHSERAE
jgi:hypothetical protein